jgi:hypothetical protein
MTTNVDLSNVTDEQRAQIIREERDRIAVAHFNAQAGWASVGYDPKNFDQIIDFMNDRVRELVGGDPRIGDSNCH